MTKKEVTIDDLARMVQNGFSEMSESFSSLLKSEISGVRTELKGEISAVRTELKEEISSVRTELKQEIGLLRNEFQDFRSETRENFKKVFSEIDDIKERLTRVEKRTIQDDNAITQEILELKQRIKVLESKYLKLKIS